MNLQRVGQDNQSSVILSLASTAVILSVECPIGPGHWGARTSVGIALPMAVRGRPSRKLRQGQMKGSGQSLGMSLSGGEGKGRRRLRER